MDPELLQAFAFSLLELLLISSNARDKILITFRRVAETVSSSCASSDIEMLLNFGRIVSRRMARFS